MTQLFISFCLFLPNQRDFYRDIDRQKRCVTYLFSFHSCGCNRRRATEAHFTLLTTMKVLSIIALVALPYMGLGFAPSVRSSVVRNEKCVFEERGKRQ